MTKTLNIALNAIQTATIDTALQGFAAESERRVDELMDNPKMFLGGLAVIALVRNLQDALSASPDRLELIPIEAKTLIASLVFLREYSMEKVGDYAQDNPELTLGALQAVVLCSDLIETICKGANALADEEEAEALRKAT